MFLRDSVNSYDKTVGGNTQQHQQREGKKIDSSKDEEIMSVGEEPVEIFPPLTNYHVIPVSRGHLMPTVIPKSKDFKEISDNQAATESSEERVLS